MNNIKFCLFCENKGIKGPHNHNLRDFKKKDKPIICPELLKNQCTYCRLNGHTKFYCEKLKQKNKKDKELIEEIKKPIVNNLKKRPRYDDNLYDEIFDEHHNKKKKSNLLTSFLGGLSISSDSDTAEKLLDKI